MSIDFYKEFGEYGYLANYSNHGFYKDGVYYPTVEHFYQSQKFSDPEIINKIISCKTPKEASNIGRCRDLIRKDHFASQKLQVMEEGVYLKFKQNLDIRSKLFETRNQSIREMSVKESYWGVGPNLDGENHIGKILEHVRSRLKEDFFKDLIDQCRDKKIYVIGHSNPDIDSYYSSFLLTRILKSFGIDCVCAVRDTSFADPKWIQDYPIADYEVVEDYNSKNFILVDHNSLDGILKENVLAAFDHHRITGEVSNLYEAEYSSCGLLLYDFFKNYYSFTEEDKTMIAFTVLSDTEFLTSSRFGEEDQLLYEELGIPLQLEELKKKYLKTNNFQLDICSNFFKDFKKYNYDKLVIKRSMIRSYHDDFNKYFPIYQKEMDSYDIDLLIWCDYEDISTFISYSDESFQFPYFTTSTYLVLDYLKEKKYLKK